MKLPSTVEQEDNDESIDQPSVTSPVVPSPQPPLLDDSTDVLTKECDEILQMIERFGWPISVHSLLLHLSIQL